MGGLPGIAFPPRALPLEARVKLIRPGVDAGGHHAGADGRQMAGRAR